MTKLSMTRFLTQPSSWDAAARETYCGQAHLGIGPDQCRNCKSWEAAGSRGIFARPARCSLATRRNGGKRGEAVPATAAACKYFEKFTP